MAKKQFKVIVWKQGTIFIGQVESLPHIKAVGRTREDVIEQLKEALERRSKDGTDHPSLE
jgi:predicted RNase H-like HicB family nuclease